MNVSPRYLRYQGSVLKTMGHVTLSSLLHRKGKPAPTVPGPEVYGSAQPRDPALIDAYIQWCGARPELYQNTVPPHLFPQWCVPLIPRTLQEIPQRLSNLINQGCRLEINAPLPRKATLDLRARLERYDEEEHKIRLNQSLHISTPADKDAVVAQVHGVIRRKTRGPKSKKPTQELADFTELGTWNASLQDGRNFGFLTGDLNPIHWIGPAARMAGFRGKILHGFGSYARTFETIVRAYPKQRIHTLEAFFVRPLLLPAKTRVLSKPQENQENSYALRLLDARDNVCLVGTYTLKPQSL